MAVADLDLVSFDVKLDLSYLFFNKQKKLKIFVTLVAV